MTRHLPIAVAIAILSFMLFRRLYLRKEIAWHRVVTVIVAFAISTPAVWFTSSLLLGIPYHIWFYHFRSIPGIEASSGLVGGLLGVVFASARLRPSSLNTPILIVSMAAATLLLIAPFGYQVFYRLDYAHLENKWADGVCLQTSQYTCVPASCATVVKMLGGSVTERELAVEMGTSRRGTEMWYMMRAMRKHGYEVEVRYAKSLKDISAPSILGVQYGGVGHAVVLMSKTDNGPEIGNPKALRKRYAWKVFEEVYHPELVYFVIHPRMSDADSE